MTTRPDTDACIAIGLNVKVARRRLKITQTRLATLTGLGQPNLCALERGRANPTILTLSVIARALGTDIAALVTTERTKRLGPTCAAGGVPTDNTQIDPKA